MRHLAIAAALGAAFFMAACGTVERAWGPELPEAALEAKAYRALSQYVYGAIPLAVYAADPGGAPGVKQAVCRLDPYEEMATALDTVRLGGDGAAVALTVLSQLALDASAAAAGGPLEVGFRGGRRIAVVLSRSLAAAAQMRIWRQGRAERLAAMADEGRPPTEAEWTALEDVAARYHARIQAPCGAAAGGA